MVFSSYPYPFIWKSDMLQKCHTVETEGIDRGRIIVDEKRLLSRKKEIKVALDVKRDLLEDYLSSFHEYL